MRSPILLLAAAALDSSAASAGPFPRTSLLLVGFREATVADFAGTPGEAARRADPNGLMAVSGDFNGDGRTDEARILLNEADGTAYVVAAIEREAKLDTYVLLPGSLEDAANIAIRLAPPKAAGGNPGIAIFTFSDGESAGIRSDFDGDGFTDGPLH
jgi:hypothetical protein